MTLESRSAGKGFELPGSKPQYPPSFPYSIQHLYLKVEPNLDEARILGEVAISIQTNTATSTIELDAVDLEVHSVEEKSKATKLDFHTRNDRLVINLGTTIYANKELTLKIIYLATPRKGFYFINPDSGYPKKRVEAWTQGQTNEASHWFPCIDHPLAKFPVEMDIVAPTGLKVISNGTLKGAIAQAGGKKTLHRWEMRTPIPAYLVSIVIGDYRMNNHGNLSFYVPKYVSKEDENRTFSRTPNIIKFFEDYFSTPYPYAKYSQVTVQDFLAQGMENASCSTLTIDTIHDKRVELDFPSENLVSHEIAHQWFGDLVTCSDWQDLWLNESFATYCEALYQEHLNGKDSMHQLVLENSDSYFDEASSRYVRPIVTNVYKHPDDLFDTHSYAKGACVLHMLRHQLGEDVFRKGIKSYLETFAHGTANTLDFIKILETVSGKGLRQFFDQWIFKPGHPEIEVAFSYDSATARVGISQVQAGQIFSFDLDLRIGFKGGQETSITIAVTDKMSTLLIPTDGRIVEWFYFNSEFETLVKVVNLKAPWELLVNQLRQGRTIVDRALAARFLKNYSSRPVVNALHDAILSDKFWSVGAEAAKSLGTIKEEYSYDALRDVLAKVKDPRTKRAVIGALGEFRRKELFGLLKPILESATESYAVQSEAATAIGKIREAQKITMLEGLIEGEETYLDLVAQGAVAGLKEFASDKKVTNIILKISEYGHRPRIREAATLALGKFAPSNTQIIDHLRFNLLRDKWFRVRKNACKALAEAEITDAISDLQWVGEHDIDAGVRRVADECTLLLKDKLGLVKQRSQVKAGAVEATEEREFEEKATKSRKMHIKFLNKIDSFDSHDR